jgi:hypothetical protein
VQEIGTILNDITPAGNLEIAPLVPMLRSYGRIAIISDFLGDSDATLKMAAQLSAAGREVHAIHVIHVNEVNPPRRTTLLTDPEDADLKRPMTENTRRRYLENFGEWREQLARDWRLAGAYYSAVVSNEPVARAVRRIAIPQTAHRGTAG